MSDPDAIVTFIEGLSFGKFFVFEILLPSSRVIDII